MKEFAVVIKLSLACFGWWLHGYIQLLKVIKHKISAFLSVNYTSIIF